jgi:hypothetical protein
VGNRCALFFCPRSSAGRGGDSAEWVQTSLRALPVQAIVWMAWQVRPEGVTQDVGKAMKIHVGEQRKSTPKMRGARAADPFRRLIHGLLIVLAVGIIAAGGVLSFYFLHFNGPVSDSIDVWASFGSFIGGTLGPMFAFFTFIALLSTIAIQARELHFSNETLKATQHELMLTREIAEAQAKQFREQMTRTELFDVIKFVHSELELRFEKRAEFSIGDRNFGYYFSFSAPSAGFKDIPQNGHAVSEDDRVVLADICELMMSLNGYLLQYEAQMGDSALTFLFKARYLTCATRLTEKEFFAPGMMRAFQSVGYAWAGPAA